MVSHEFDGEPSDVSVRIDRDSDGTNLVQTTTINVVALSTTTYGYQLTPEHTGLLDWLYVTWTATIDGVSSTFEDTVEVAGGVLFSIAEERRMSNALADPAKVPDRRVLEMRTT